MSGQTVLLTSIAMYAAIWHRGRQSLGVARFYQRGMGGPASPVHDRLFQSAVYLPMMAALLSYAHLAPLEYEGEPYFALDLGAGVSSVVAIAAAACVIAYLTWVWRTAGGRLRTEPHDGVVRVHPGESWVVLANAVAFGSGYVLGASNASFLLVLAVYHEVQYLYFAYAMSRRSAIVSGACTSATDDPIRHSYSTALSAREDDVRFELKHAASFLVWPVISFGGAVVGGWFALEWLAPLGLGGLFCHYWLDGRIWTRKSFQS
jgi:hypothetical protein